MGVKSASAGKVLIGLPPTRYPVYAVCVKHTADAHMLYILYMGMVLIWHPPPEYLVCAVCVKHIVYAIYAIYATYWQGVIIASAGRVLIWHPPSICYMR